LFSKFFNYINSNESSNSVPEIDTKTGRNYCSSQPLNKTMSKAQKLHNSHKMNEQQRGWFSVPPEYSWLHQSLPQTMEQPKYKHFTPSSQAVYNITRNCYENLPVYQEQNQAMSSNLPNWMVGEMESENLVELEVGCAGFIMYAKSDQRLAAEILANSRLNPNAKEFTPKTVIERLSEGEDEDTMVQLDGHKELEEDEIPRESDYVCDITFTGEGDINSEEEEEEEEDDDWDWDSDEQSTGECVIVDPADFEDLFTPSLLMTNLSSNCPCLHKSTEKTNPKLREANKRFLQIYPDVEDADTELTHKTVKFSNDPTIILEPENLAEELQLARIGEFAARQADRERMERLLAPILTQTHRQNIYNKIYGESSN